MLHFKIICYPASENTVCAALATIITACGIIILFAGIMSKLTLQEQWAKTLGTKE